MPEPIYELTDVEVDTLGLVTRGANREEFFLLKAEGNDNQVSEAYQPEVEAAAQSIWQRLLATIKKALTEPAFSESVPDNTSVNTDAAQVTEQVVNKDATIVAQTPDAVDAEPVTKQVEIPVTTAVVPPISKEALMPDENVTKAQYDSLAVRLEKAEAELAKAQEEKEQAVWLAKAQNYGYMPVASTELAEQLHFLSKTAPTRAEWWMDVLKACDNMVRDSGLFVEKGTTIEAEDATLKLLKASDPKAAALALPRQEAEAYLREVRRRSKGV